MELPSQVPANNDRNASGFQERAEGAPYQFLQTRPAKLNANHARTQQRKRDRSGENFRKRWRTLVETLHKLHQDYEAEFHISLSRKRQDYVCRSRSEFLPLSADDIVGAPWLCRCL
ncbi:hypothetical protein QBC46DRAFT_411567 [Diplogelasinospora grovesii]|uniref:Uncharacterized protein n=1 Tax=Diplogelasinospora grovesii TaxID=303347 RepID=A0AAN6N270_9PEZI|nr:hypothetical protein QBC46DRAFT_411567 [Diplogelasinospora grovesii]